MKLFSIIFFFSFLGAFFAVGDDATDSKGVYVISITSKGEKSFKFPEDSIFVDNGSAIEKLLRLDETFYDNRSEIKESLDKYYLIDFKKNVFRNIGKNLNKPTLNGPQLPLEKKELGHSFNYLWHANEKYKMTDTVYMSKKVKKMQYQKTDGARCEVLMKINASKQQSPVFFRGIEDKFKADVLKIVLTYPGQKGSFIYIKKFIPLKSHEVFKAMDKWTK